jgi:hypothetical protein|nr:MAG: hypothetical protein [Bacteriophage sp.]
MSERTKNTIINLSCLIWLFGLLLISMILQNMMGLVIFIVGYGLPSVVLSILGWLWGETLVDKLAMSGYGFFYIGDSAIIALESIRYDIADWRSTPKPKHKNFRY